MERPLFWHQGLFLQPQHLQLTTRYCEALNLPFKEYMQSHFWGVGSWQVQTTALDNHSFHLTEGKFLFPDMTYAVIGENALVMPRSFDSQWEEGSKQLGVYLGIRKFNGFGSNVTVIKDENSITEVATRWVTPHTTDQTPDLHQNGPAANIKKLQYVLKLFWETEKDRLGDYELIPLTRLEKDQDRIRFSRRDIPPCLTICADETLLKIVKEIRDQIGSRSRQLEAYKKDRGLHTAGFGTKDMVYLLALRSLNRYGPLLAHMTSAQPGHPCTVYGLLRQLIGELSTFSADIGCNGEDKDGVTLLPEYSHTRLGNCFRAAQALVTRLLDQITAGPEYILPLQYDGTYFGTELPPSIFERQNRFFLVLETESDPQLLLPAMKNIAKLGCRESLPIFIARSLSGVALTHLEQVPQELPRRTHALYFQIDHHSDQWAQVQKSKNMALYWDAAPNDLKAELMAVARS
jgi:type VI secretion system protein ImpJ